VQIMSGRKRRGEGGGSPPSPSGSGGVYRVVEPPKRLVYTWRWENEPDAPEPLVTVEFRDRGVSTNSPESSRNPLAKED